MSHDVSVSRSFPISIAASLLVMYSSSTGVVPKVRLRQRKASFHITTMHVDSICVLAWTYWYAASRSVFSYQDSF